MTRKVQSDHHFSERLEDEFIGVSPEVVLVLISHDAFEVTNLHHLALEESLAYFRQDAKHGFVEYDMVILDFLQVGHELVHLLLTDLQTVVQLLVHYLPQLELLRRTQVIEGVLGLVEHFLLPQDTVTVLEGIFQKAI
jgi:hypothetical protein